MATSCQKEFVSFDKLVFVCFIENQSICDSKTINLLLFGLMQFQMTFFLFVRMNDLMTVFANDTEKYFV